MIAQADLIVTDCWPPDAKETARIALSEFRITQALLDQCDPAKLFVPCPPVTCGQEVSSDAMQHPPCLCTPAKARRMDVQNAIVKAVL